MSCPYCGSRTSACCDRQIFVENIDTLRAQLAGAKAALIAARREGEYAGMLKAADWLFCRYHIDVDTKEALRQAAEEVK